MTFLAGSPSRSRERRPISLVLLPQVHLLKPRPAKTAQLTEVFKLQDPAGAKNLDPFFWKSAMPIAR